MSEASNNSNSNPQPEAKPQMDEALAQSAAQATSDPATAAVTDPLAEAQAELANLKAQNADLADQYLRAQADVQNARRRAQSRALPTACCRCWTASRRVWPSPM